ncbi:MAG TPA: hypothetical protein VMT70_15955 [Vicinamibacteria bacterium]|nr:hypothetical protein [Vicinamibacteria bacterium]
MDTMRRAALSSFYREEFLRHIACLKDSGVLDETNREVAERACHALCTRLDELCALKHFPELAETVLQSFDALSRLSDLDPRQRH